jgi:methylated-DNA-[protein]-cysteine S-methyltransferase
MRRDQQVDVFKTSLGWAGIALSDQGIRGIILPKKNKKAVERELVCPEFGVMSKGKSSGGIKVLLKQSVLILQRYFAGECVSFDLPLDLRYFTAFQQAVWRAAAEIPYGETRSYGWIAKRINNPRAVRAVGQALGTNPVPIIIPCHRVISAAGTLGGFSGGIGLKKKLLDMEAKANDRR